MLNLIENFRPDRQGTTPIYMQIADKIGKAISKGDWQLNEALPSERILSEQLSVSRVTIRKAINVLSDRNMLMQKQGAGTFIRNDQRLRAAT